MNSDVEREHCLLLHLMEIFRRVQMYRLQKGAINVPFDAALNDVTRLKEKKKKSRFSDII